MAIWVGWARSLVVVTEQSPQGAEATLGRINTLHGKLMPINLCEVFAYISLMVH